ncbi:MAG: TlpA disulfide reductase family protein [Sphingomonadales bacterium]|jgi:thiol-disulfide isomerase/thioredoxin
MKLPRPLIWLTLVLATAAALMIFSSEGDKSKPLELQAFLKGDMADLQLLDSPQMPPQLVFYKGADEGKQLGLDAFKGQIVVLNLWATWCAPCVHELPSLDRLQDKLGGKDLTVIALSMDRGGAETTKPFLAKLGIENLELYSDPKAITMRALKSAALPITLILDRKGQIVARYDGPAEWDGPEAITLLRAVMAD